MWLRETTVRRAQSLGVRSWVRNTPRRTVDGEVQGLRDKVQSMKHFLQYEGSPASQIDRAKFRNEREISTYDHDTFEVRR
jgi:acylphosphatase